MNVARIPASWSVCAALLLATFVGQRPALAIDSNAVGRVSGQVVDASGAPVANAKIRFVPLHDPNATAPEATTNKKGKFTVGFFPAGSYRPEIVADEQFIGKMEFRDRTMATNSSVAGGSAEGEAERVNSSEFKNPDQNSGAADAPVKAGKTFFSLKPGQAVDMTLTVMKGKALKTSGKQPLIIEANEMFQKGDNEGVLAATERILMLEPENGAALYLRGVTLVRVKQGDQAVPLLRKAVEKLPNQPGIQTVLGSALMDQGFKLEDEKKLDEAKPVFAEAAGLLQQGATTMTDPTPALTNAIIALQHAGKAEEALGTMKTLVEQNPGNVSLHFGYVDALNRAGKKAEAEQELLAIQVPDGDTPNKLKLAEALGNAGKTDQAMAILDTVTIDSRDAAAVLYNTAAAMMGNGKNDVAIKALERAAKGQPGLAFVQRGLAMAYLASERYKDAIAPLKESLRLDPNGPNAAMDKEMLTKLEASANAPAANAPDPTEKKAPAKKTKKH